MRIGTGVQNKLLEAMSMSITCITTPLSFNPIGVSDGEGVFSIQTKEEAAAKMIELLNDPTINKIAGEKGRNFVIENYSIEKINDIVNSQFSDVLK